MRSLPPPRFPSSAPLSAISLGRDQRFHYSARRFCPRRTPCAPCASRLLSSTLTPFLRLLLMRRLLFLSYTRARGSPSISSCFLLRASFSSVCAPPHRDTCVSDCRSVLCFTKARVALANNLWSCLLSSSAPRCRALCLPHSLRRIECNLRCADP